MYMRSYSILNIECYAVYLYASIRNVPLGPTLVRTAKTSYRLSTNHYVRYPSQLFPGIDQTIVVTNGNAAQRDCNSDSSPFFTMRHSWIRHVISLDRSSFAKITSANLELVPVSIWNSDTRKFANSSFNDHRWSTVQIELWLKRSKFAHDAGMTARAVSYHDLEANKRMLGGL
jgi:hypothetical protein